MHRTPRRAARLVAALLARPTGGAGPRASVALGVALTLAVAAGAGCSAALGHPTEVEAGFAQARWPGTTVAELERGRSLYVKKCAGCHQLHLPEEYGPERWSAIVVEMSVEAKLAPAEHDLVDRFLTSASAGASARHTGRAVQR